MSKTKNLSQLILWRHAHAEEGAVAEREVAGVARQDVPRGGEHDPVRHQVEEGLVEGRQLEQRQAGQHRAGDEEAGGHRDA